jgi:hypothetical protein
MSSNEMFRQLPFPFAGGVFPRQLGAVVQKTVLSGEEPARLVVHTDDNSWLVGDGINDPNDPGASVATHIWHVIESDPSVGELASLGCGFQVTREGPDEPWYASPFSFDDDDG